jgi:hypothetical protein
MNPLYGGFFSFYNLDSFLKEDTLSIIWSDPPLERGRKDAHRHRDKQRELIKEQLPRIISEEPIIIRKGGKMVKIPLRFLRIPTFQPKRLGEGGIGTGQGDGEPGDILEKDKQEPELETQAPIEEIIEMMYEDLGLPNLQTKKIKEIETLMGIKLGGIVREGTPDLRNTKATAIEGLKRFWQFLYWLQQETKQDELCCFNALKQTNGMLEDATRLLNSGKLIKSYTVVEPFPIVYPQDLRYQDYKDNSQKKSQAAAILMMDVSASMTDAKKYAARSIGFWYVERLRKIYQNVQVRFIVHSAEAWLVEEDVFFHTRESGGTLCWTAYALANDLIATTYPTQDWNVYVIHFSDGDDANVQKTVEEIKKLFDKKISMLGYPEIHIEDYFPSNHELLNALKKNLPIFNELVRSENHSMNLVLGKGSLPFVGGIINDKKDIYLIVRELLRKERRWQAA